MWMFANTTQFQVLSRPPQKPTSMWRMNRASVVHPFASDRRSVVQRATSAVNERMLQDEFSHQVSSSVLHETSIEEEIWFGYCNEDGFCKYPEY